MTTTTLSPHTHASASKKPCHGFNTSRGHSRLPAAYLSVLLCALTSAFATVTVHAQTVDKTASSAKDPWTVSVGLGVARAPEYEGAKKSAVSPFPDLNVSYKTQYWGGFYLGGKQRGLTWKFLEQDAYSLGVIVQLDPGRSDKKDGNAFQPGSKRLLGMGEIASSVELGLTGHAVWGVPIYFSLVKGSGDGKPRATDLRSNGHGGTRLEVGLEVPYQVTPELSVSLSPNLVWADSKYTQSYFGVTAEQAARSGFNAFVAKGGIKSFGLSLGANCTFTKHWSANVGLSVSQLRGDAAKSPVVEQKRQTSATAGVLYTF
jgi:MipA family protein